MVGYLGGGSTTAGSSAQVPECLPLLKFDADLEKPHLCDAGLHALSALPPPVSVVTILGDGRCGKSTLASRLIHDDKVVFPVGKTGSAVTDGIDMCIVPRSGTSEGSLVILDCEGGNNPTGQIHGAVDLVAMLASTITVQVVWGQMSEAQLLQIGQGIADRDRLLLGQSSIDQRLPEHQLLLVVNGCHLEYSPDHVNKALMEVHTGSASARNELRSNIKRAFEEIHFLTVPFDKDISYKTHLEKVRRSVADNCTPSALSGVRLSGAQIAEMLKSTVSELRKGGSVPVPSVFRHVIFDHLLKPLLNKLLDSFKASLPDLRDGEYRQMMPDGRHETLHTFDTETKTLRHSELVAEAREDLRKRADVAWQRVMDQNSAIGEQDRDVSTESEMRFSHTEDRVVSWRRGCLGIGKTAPIVEPCSVFRVWTRTRVLKKNGLVAYSDWAPSSHSVDGSSLGGSLTGSGRWNSTYSSQQWNSMRSSGGGAVGERSCTPAGPLMNSMQGSVGPADTASLTSTPSRQSFSPKLPFQPL